MAKITNPTEDELSIQYKGVVYTIPARGSISRVSNEVATYWKTMIHEFIQVSEDEIVKVEVKKEVKEVGQVKEEVKKEVKSKK